MSRDKQIEEMAEIISSSVCTGVLCSDCEFEGNPACFMMYKASSIYNAGYRKIYDDHQRQCTCYALGCQMAEELKRKVAREIFEEIQKIIDNTDAELFEKFEYEEKWAAGEAIGTIDQRLAELKKKYTKQE